MEVNMESNYDFSDAIKNPFAGREKGKYTVTIHYDSTESHDTETVEKSADVMSQPVQI